MHRCLQIPEILFNILDYMALRVKAPCRDLLSVALVSKVFNEPALDVLWRFQKSFPPLIKTFPRDLWIESGTPKRLTFRRPLTQADLDRYLFYGKKIRKLQVSQHPTDGDSFSLIDPGVFRAIATFLDVFHPGCIILPNLRELVCYDSPHGPLWEIIPLLSPSLQCVRLVCDEPWEPPTLSALALLSALAAKSPFMKRLVVGYANHTAISIPTSRPFPCGLWHLSAFANPGIPTSRDAIGHLANLPSLCELSLWFSDSYAGSFSTLAMPTEPFPSLRDLTLNGERFASGIEFIRNCLRSASLSSIDVCAEDKPSAGEIYRLFSALSSSLLPQSLTSIYLHHHHYISYDENGPPLEASDFEPLLPFTNLDLLQLQIASSPQNLSDNHLERMAKAWPRLVGLHLASSGFRINPSQCTLHGILLLAKQCPSLRALTIPFILSAPISWNGRPGEGIVNQCMEELDVGRSPIIDPVTVASLLSDIFPNLKLIQAWDDLDFDVPEEVQYSDKWMETIRLYHQFAKIRKEERAWAAHQGRNQQAG